MKIPAREMPGAVRPPLPSRDAEQKRPPMTAEERARFQHGWHKARRNGITYDTYHSRVRQLEWSIERASTEPALHGPRPDSIRTRCQQAGISRRWFYEVRDELRGADRAADTDSVIRECQARQRKTR